MSKRFLFIVLGIFALGLFVNKVTAATPVFGRKIVIDPGHGGNNSGSTECAGLREKDANLDIAFRLKGLLDADVAEVYMTRTDDSTKSNRQRYEFANSKNGEVLVSIHLNGSTNHSANGTLGLYGKRNKDLAFTKTIHKQLATDFEVPDLGVTNFASGVLLKSDMPATMQEAVYISNTQECAALTDETGARQQEIAESLYNGLVDWFSQSDPGGGNGKGKKCESPPCKK